MSPAEPARKNAVLITADEKLYRAVAGSGGQAIRLKDLRVREACEIQWPDTG